MPSDLHLCLSIPEHSFAEKSTDPSGQYVFGGYHGGRGFGRGEGGRPDNRTGQGKTSGATAERTGRKMRLPPPPTAADRTQRAESHEEMIALLKCELSRVSRPPCVRRASEPSGRARVLTWRQGGSGRRIFQRGPWRRIRTVTAPSLPGIGRGRQR